MVLFFKPYFGLVAEAGLSLLLGLANYLLIPLPGWIPSNDGADHWERGPRGIIARRLVGGLADGTLAPSRRGRRNSTRAERLRDQLR